MPAQPRKAANRGRRDPALLEQPSTGDPVLDQQLGDEMESQHFDDPNDPDSPEPILLFAGDIVTANVTLAVDVTGNGKTDFIGYRATTRVQPGEDQSDVFSRVASVVGDGVLSEAHDVAERWAEYEEFLENQRQEVARVTGQR